MENKNNDKNSNKPVIKKNNEKIKKIIGASLAIIGTVATVTIAPATISHESNKIIHNLTGKINQLNQGIEDAYSSKNQFLGTFKSGKDRLSFLDTRFIVPKDFFKNNKGIKLIDMPEVSTIQYAGFKNSASLEKASFNNLTNIENFAFQGSLKLKYFEAPKLTIIPRGAFDHTALGNNFNFSQIKEVGDVAFASVAGMTELIAPNLTKVGVKSFAGNKLTKIFIPNLKDEDMLLKASGLFKNVVNKASTVVTLSKTLEKSTNLLKIKNKLFKGEHDVFANWGNITFKFQ